MQDIFFDRLGNVSIGNGVARLDFQRLVGVDREKKQLRYQPAARVVLPLDGFVQTVDQLVKMRDELVKSAAKKAKAPAESAQAQ